ncbi:ribonuclease inhibitor [Lentzea flaviverrucosa]|uniref:Leucine Rich repeat-containing protein n=1 Tax=Lentzea flaviverrucosa TaxID=200379 RepID=A0A1H9GLP5_9PSEU|nr:ribonuclease inhibitor [Lentzea flaviverrucosa]RDI34867.1 leucine rich repeat (LRR) protein [Lentzea flaviverrucosa]SEQ51017.1 Leucine Rich repeat-containing protein [Lentzea flaviverrucosa]
MVNSLEPLLAWLRTGTTAVQRLDFPTGTALPDGRLDLCKQDLGPGGAALVAQALRPGVVKHLLLGTGGLGDGAAEVAGEAVQREVETLYLGCNGITAGGACRIADNLRMSPQASRVTGIWLKRNPIGDGDAAAGLVESARSLRTLDLVQTGLDAAAVQRLVAAMITAAAANRPVERLYLGGNPLGPAGATHLAALLAAEAVSELYVSAAGLGDDGARTVADALVPGRLRRISLASNGIGPQAAARLVAAAATAGVEVCDLGRVKAAGVLGAEDNRLDAQATTAIADALAERPHRLRHLVLSNTGLGSQAAHRLLDGAQRAATPTRFVLGKGVAGSIRRRLDALSAAIPARPPVSADVAAVRSVHRQPVD